MAFDHIFLILNVRQARISVLSLFQNHSAFNKREADAWKEIENETVWVFNIRISLDKMFNDQKENNFRQRQWMKRRIKPEN